MAFFDKLGNTISAAGKDGLNKAKELKDTTKLKLSIKEREGLIQKLYRDLGKAYYEAHKDDEDSEYEEIDDIRAAFAEIGELRADHDAIRGVKRCRECGTIVSQEANFCFNCGAKCENEAEVVECEIVEDEDEDDNTAEPDETETADDVETEEESEETTEEECTEKEDMEV